MKHTHYDDGEGAIFVGSFKTTDEAVLREASRWPTGERGDPVDLADLDGADLTAFAYEALSIGARVLSIAAQSSDTLAVQAAVKSASDTVNDSVSRASDAMRLAASQAQNRLAEHLSDLIGGESPELLERMRPAFAAVGRDIERELLVAVNRANEIQRAESDRRHEELTTLMHGVRQDVAVRAAEKSVKERTTLKGFDYEAQVNDICRGLASDMGDEFRDTTTETGLLPRNKKGDGVFYIAGDMARIVIESHDGESKEWGQYLAEAERNRGASVSIGLVRHLADNHGSLMRVIGPKRVVLAFDPDVDDVEVLRTVVLLMKTGALATSGQFDSARVAEANGGIREAMSLIEGLDEAKKSAAAIRGHVDKIEFSVNKAAAGVQRELQRALNALSGPGTGDSTGPAGDDSTGQTHDYQPSRVSPLTPA